MDLTEDELLAKAKRDYPLGCYLLSAYNHTKYKLESTEFYYNISNNTIRSDIYVYDKGRWAEIVSYPEGYIKEEINNSYIQF